MILHPTQWQLAHSSGFLSYCRLVLSSMSASLTTGACVLLFFVILAGVRDSTPLNETFFISADVSKISGANIDSPSGYGQWTLWGVCGATTDGKNVNCGSHHPAYPFSPADNFGSNGVPQYFIDHENFYWYASRFMFAFFIIALAFAVFSVFTGLLALCSRLGSAVSSIFALVSIMSRNALISGRLCHRYRCSSFNDRSLRPGT